MEAHNLWRSLGSGDPLLDPEGHEDRLWRPTTSVTKHILVTAVFPLRSILIGCEEGRCSSCPVEDGVEMKMYQKVLC